MHFTYACQKSCQLFMNAICSCVCVSEVCKMMDLQILLYSKILGSLCTFLGQYEGSYCC